MSSNEHIATGLAPKTEPRSAVRCRERDWSLSMEMNSPYSNQRFVRAVLLGHVMMGFDSSSFSSILSLAACVTCQHVDPGLLGPQWAVVHRKPPARPCSVASCDGTTLMVSTAINTCSLPTFLQSAHSVSQRLSRHGMRRRRRRRRKKPIITQTSSIAIHEHREVRTICAYNSERRKTMTCRPLRRIPMSTTGVRAEKMILNPNFGNMRVWIILPASQTFRRGRVVSEELCVTFVLLSWLVSILHSGRVHHAFTNVDLRWTFG